MLTVRVKGSAHAVHIGAVALDLPGELLVSVLILVLLLGVGVMAPMGEKEVGVEPTTGAEGGCSSVVFLMSLLGSDVESVGRVDFRGGQAGSRQDQLGES